LLIEASRRYEVCEKQKGCGKNTACKPGIETLCFCKRGYTGNPLTECFKLNKESPCDPNPCGDGATCITNDDKIGAHCRCLPEFIGWPPKCKAGCSSHEDCAEDELCDDSRRACIKTCEPSPCGENAICRVDKINKRTQCSCIDGFIPQSGVGCRKKLPNDKKFPGTDAYSFSSEEAPSSESECDQFCADSAYCSLYNETLECSCGTFPHNQGNPFYRCVTFELIHHHVIAVLSG
jgi:hypothetical protein